MGIEPTWDSLHCPTPDLKSGSPTSELGTSGRFITKIPPSVEGFKASRLYREAVRCPSSVVRCSKAQSAKRIAFPFLAP